MISRGRALVNTVSCLRYGLKESKGAEIVLRQYVVGDNAEEIAREFGGFQEQYHGSHRKLLSFMLSPTPEDGRGLDRPRLREIAKRFIREMKLSEHQAVAIVHRDRDHVHLHLYINRVDLMGRHERNGFLNLRTATAAQQVALALGLTTVKEAIQKKLEPSKQIRGEIKAVHDKVIRRERPRNYDRYVKAMEKYHVKPVPFINNRNELMGFRFQYKDQSFKGSEVHPDMSMGNIAKQLSFDRRELKKIIADRKMPFMGKHVKVPFHFAKVLIAKSVQMAQRVARDSAIEI